MPNHYTQIADEGRQVRDGVDADPLAEARKLHHLASADPEPGRDGMLTGPAHEKLYGLERAEDSDAAWRSRGVHPTENRALVEGEDGAENLRGAVPSDDSAPADIKPKAAATTK